MVGRGISAHHDHTGEILSALCTPHALGTFLQHKTSNLVGCLCGAVYKGSEKNDAKQHNANGFSIIAALLQLLLLPSPRENSICLSFQSVNNRPVIWFQGYSFTPPSWLRYKNALKQILIPPSPIDKHFFNWDYWQICAWHLKGNLPNALTDMSQPVHCFVLLLASPSSTLSNATLKDCEIELLVVVWSLAAVSISWRRED